MEEQVHEELIDEIRRLRETGQDLVERVEDVAASIRYMTNNLLDHAYHPEMAASVSDLARNVESLISLSPTARDGEALPPFTRDVEGLSRRCSQAAERCACPQAELPLVMAQELTALVAMLQADARVLAESEQFGEESAWVWWENRFEAVRDAVKELDRLHEQAATHGVDLSPHINHRGGIPEALLPQHWPEDLVAAYDEADAIEATTPSVAQQDASEEKGTETTLPVACQRELFSERFTELADGQGTSESSLAEPVVPEFRESQCQGGMDSLSTILEEGHHRPYTLDDFRAFSDERDQTQLTADTWKAEYHRLKQSEQVFVDSLKQNHNAKGLQQLALRCGAYDARRQTKDENAAAIYRACLKSFVLGNSISYNPMAETIEAAVDRLVEGLTNEDFTKHYAALEQKQAEQQKAIENPETLLEFHAFIEKLGEASLTDEQHLRRDQLYADLSRQTRADRTATTVERLQATDLDGLEFNITEGHHEKRGCPLWIVQLSSRVERQAYDELKRKAQQLGGWYSSFKKDQAGFQFLSHESAEKFAGLKEGDADRSDELEDRQIRKLENVADRFTAMADRLQERASDALEADDGKLKYTVRRAEQAASTRARAREELATAQTLRSLAAQLREGEATYLDGIRYAVQIDTLRSILRRARWSHIKHSMENEHGELSNYDRHVKQDALEQRSLDASDVRFVEYPKPYLYRGHLERACTQLASTSGLKQITEKMRKIVARTPTVQDFVEFYHDSDIELLEDFVGRAKGAGYYCYWFEHCLDDYKRLRSANIHDAHELRSALAELLPHLNSAGRDDPIAVAVDALRGKELPRFFPTPRPVILQMLDLANIQGDDRVLEPSCGMGDILEAIRASHPEVDLKAIERNHMLADVLAAKGYDEIVTYGDFLEHQSPYDTILLNPPFEAGAEIEHVRHAFELLSVGGRLVSVMSKGPFFRSDNKSREFREWLDGLEHDVQELPEDAFRGVEAFRQTGVQTCLVVINKTV